MNINMRNILKNFVEYIWEATEEAANGNLRKKSPQTIVVDASEVCGKLLLWMAPFFCLSSIKLHSLPTWQNWIRMAKLTSTKKSPQKSVVVDGTLLLPLLSSIKLRSNSAARGQHGKVLVNCILVFKINWKSHPDLTEGQRIMQTWYLARPGGRVKFCQMSVRSREHFYEVHIKMLSAPY